MNILITGANRGIGLAMVKEALSRGHQVTATARRLEAAEALNRLSLDNPERLSVQMLDVTDDTSIERLAAVLNNSKEALDVLINNAGVSTEKNAFPEVTRAAFLDVLDINTVAPLLMTRALLPALKKADNPKVVHISSILGSIESHSPDWAWKNYPYNSSKTALNMVSRMMHFDLKADGVSVFAVHPGWVRTDLGGDQAPLSTEDSASMLLDRVETLKADDSGGYIGPDGETLPW